jgi:hypothetical protein
MCLDLRVNAGVFAALAARRIFPARLRTWPVRFFVSHRLHRLEVA